MSYNNSDIRNFVERVEPIRIDVGDVVQDWDGNVGTVRSRDQYPNEGAWVVLDMNDGLERHHRVRQLVVLRDGAQFPAV